MRLDHPIFHTPLEPVIELEEIPTPDRYGHWEANLPETLAAWKVQSGELGKTVDYGLVSTPYGFEDSPDAEVISSGVNSKSPRSVALGRQGNWFLWGFAGDPTQMTDSAQQVFLNSLVWMQQFDGAAPLRSAGDRKPHRDMAFVHVQFLRSYAGDTNMASYFRGQFPPELFEQTGGDPDALETYYRQNLEWLRPTTQKVEREVPKPDGTTQIHEYDRDVLAADPILAAARVSNRTPAFFQHVLAGFAANASDPEMLELAERYLPADAPREVDALRSWLEQCGDRLYFSDVFGYRWFVAPASLDSKTTAVGAEQPVGGGGP